MNSGDGVHIPTVRAYRFRLGRAPALSITHQWHKRWRAYHPLASLCTTILAPVAEHAIERSRGPVIWALAFAAHITHQSLYLSVTSIPARYEVHDVRGACLQSAPDDSAARAIQYV